ncbi:bifunctional Ubiquitin fusion degradation protein Ufd1-like/Ufd1-like [Babesia duncani]|uniref:Bifunctional Ubiquitin fusion degradation protein Ufd1-like/Ufd1-like n=1 Tax=Babesia duncani TaxID=323732 RepID=A0AAD9PMN7_9APIC|nr:bifunctional Ubiquitin fusion degradation protein Ufd1-like/Ufd1-like [Babesia duncani]
MPTHGCGKFILLLFFASLNLAVPLRIDSGHKRLQGLPISSIGIWNRIQRAINRASVESYIHDVNVRLANRDNIPRLLMVLELSEEFGRPYGMNRTKDGSKIYINNSDKVSLPESISNALFQFDIQVPWNFIIQKVHVCSLSSTQENKFGPKLKNVHAENMSSRQDEFNVAQSHQERLACTALDFRAPEGFIFIPKWMMLCLDLRPYDLVHLENVKLPEATKVTIMPLDDAFKNVDEPKKVLEDNLKHYATLSRGSCISITHKQVTYTLKIVSIDTKQAKNVECASIQDLDVAVDLVTHDYSSSQP